MHVLVGTIQSFLGLNVNTYCVSVSAENAERMTPSPNNDDVVSKVPTGEEEAGNNHKIL